MAHAQQNTLEAFELALRLGATGLESDVWLTADGHAVLDHDGVVGRIRRTPIAGLERRSLPDHIPGLRDLYAACGSDFELALDVKDPAAALEAVAVARETGGDAEERLWLCHPDWETAASWRELSTSVRLVDSTRLRRMAGGPERRAAQLVSAGVDAVNLHHSDWTGGHVALFHRFGIEALAWDCQHDRVLDEILDAGIDAVFSDHVDRMVAALERVV
jgi:glycerophosphoryl diester phosphodiesterase